MRRLTVASLLLVSLVARAGPDAPRRTDAADPCAAAKARIPEQAEAAGAHARADIESYRASWRVACDPSRGPADVAALLAEAEALVTDVRIGRAVVALVEALPPGAAWPLPGIHRHGGVVDLDWSAFEAFVPRGSAEDGRFFRGLARAMRPDGEPTWLGEPGPDGEPCLRLAETSWTDVAQGVDEMERSRGVAYARRAAFVRERLMATLDRIAAGGVVCSCVRGDPATGLDVLGVSSERLGTPERRALVASARAAAEALRVGKARVSWLREAAGAPVTGCGAGPR